MEARRLPIDVLKLSAGTPFRPRIDGDAERLEGGQHEASQSLAAADESAAGAGGRRRHQAAAQPIGLRLRGVLTIDHQRGFSRKVTHVLIDPFYAGRTVMVV